MNSIKKNKKETIIISKNQSLVLKLLEKKKQPLTAYTILDKLRNYGFRAPLQVYRALDNLIEIGKVHRVESMNAFVACNNEDCIKLDFTAFAICDECENVSEIKETLGISFNKKAPPTDAEIKGVLEGTIKKPTGIFKK